MEILGIVAAAAIAAVAWLYQKAWERQERRVARYEAVMNRLPALSAQHRDPVGINHVISIYHELWISGPDEVVKAFRHFLDITGDEQFGQTEPQVIAGALADLVIAMRTDASFANAILPGRRTKLTASDFSFKAGVT